jgi:ElaB/YqjD/DUF883 family membrane-anchored ribosome-binding protein
MSTENSDLARLIDEVDALLRAGVKRLLEAEKSDPEDVIAKARDKLVKLEGELEAEVRKGARSAAAYIHRQPWPAMGATAAVAFLLGYLAHHRDE